MNIMKHQFVLSLVKQRVRLPIQRDYELQEVVMRKRSLARVRSLICILGLISLFGCSSSASDVSQPQPGPGGSLTFAPDDQSGVIKRVSLGGGISGVTAPVAGT